MVLFPSLLKVVFLYVLDRISFSYVSLPRTKSRLGSNRLCVFLSYLFYVLSFPYWTPKFKCGLLNRYLTYLFAPFYRTNPNPHSFPMFRCCTFNFSAAQKRTLYLCFYRSYLVIFEFQLFFSPCSTKIQ
jgi:hypothetical protein